MNRPPDDEMTKRLARCIGIWETNRGGDEPKPRESELDTVAGVHASMATIEQATMPYALEAFAKYVDLRSAAEPALSLAEITSASACCTAVKVLLADVDRAIAASMRPAQFIGKNATLIATTFLSGADVETMFSASSLKGKIDRLRPKTAKSKKARLQAAETIPVAERLGLGVGSLAAYIGKASNWGEHRAGWQRRAVNAMPSKVGARLEKVATAQNGLALALPVVSSRVKATLAIHPNLTATQLVPLVAQQNNPREAGYGDNVLKIYKRLFP